jgi:alkyl hydroperoxide reductase subunit AhpF
METQQISKWKDPLFIKKYNREKQREKRGGLKKHEWILDDGSKWSDFNNCGKNKYIKKEKVKCPICQTHIFEGNKEYHEKSKKHNDAVAIIENLNQKITSIILQHSQNV